MNREQAESLLAQMVFDDLEEPVRSQLIEYLKDDPELNEQLGDMRLTAKLLRDAVGVEDAPKLDPLVRATLHKRIENEPRRKGVLAVLSKPIGNRLAAYSALLAACVIIVGLLLPSLGAARRSSRQMKMTTQARGIGQGLYLYAEENKGRYPDRVSQLVEENYISADYLISPNSKTRLPSNFNEFSQQKQNEWIDQNSSFKLLVGGERAGGIDSQKIVGYMEHGESKGVSVARGDGSASYESVDEVQELIGGHVQRLSSVTSPYAAGDYQPDSELQVQQDKVDAARRRLAMQDSQAVDPATELLGQSAGVSGSLGEDDRFAGGKFDGYGGGMGGGSAAYGDDSGAAQEFYARGYSESDDLALGRADGAGRWYFGKDPLGQAGESSSVNGTVYESLVEGEQARTALGLEGEISQHPPSGVTAFDNERFGVTGGRDVVALNSPTAPNSLDVLGNLAPQSRPGLSSDSEVGSDALALNDVEDESLYLGDTTHFAWKLGRPSTPVADTPILAQSAVVAGSERQPQAEVNFRGIGGVERSERVTDVRRLNRGLAAGQQVVGDNFAEEMEAKKPADFELAVTESRELDQASGTIQVNTAPALQQKDGLLRLPADWPQITSARGGDEKADEEPTERLGYLLSQEPTQSEAESATVEKTEALKYHLAVKQKALQELEAKEVEESPDMLGNRLVIIEDVQPPARKPRLMPVNPWVMAEEDRLSTFALDVDNASYGIARQYINNGFLPPKHTVRMEEFVNNFDYNYPTGQNDSNAFTVHAEAGRSPFNPGNVLMKIGVRGKVVGRDQARPAHLVFVIDTSGSMERADRLPLVKQSLVMALEQLSDQDRVSVVTYGTGANLLVENESASAAQRLQESVKNLQVGGSTNMLAGVALAYEIAERHYTTGGVNRLILCSDGVANIGPSQADDLIEQAAEYRGQGVTFTSVGFGSGNYDDNTLEQLANRGDGGYHFVGSVDEAKRLFVDDLAATRPTIAYDGKIQVDFDPARIRRYRLIGYENRDIADADFRNDTVDAGEVGSGQSSTALYELELNGPVFAADGQPDLGTVYVRYRDADTGQVREIQSRLTNSLIDQRTPTSVPRFYLAASAAQFAEVLRGSEHVDQEKTDGNLAAVQSVMEVVAAQLPLDGQVAELRDLVTRSRGLPQAE